MTTANKLLIASLTTSTLLTVYMFSKFLHIPEESRWVAIVGAILSAAFGLHFRGVQRREKAEAARIKATASSVTITSPTAIDHEVEQRKRTKRGLLLVMAIGCIINLSAPLWMPLTNTPPMDPKEEFMIGLVIATIICTVAGLKLRKL
jgi:cytochrome c biogenesis protein CcdA